MEIQDIRHEPTVEELQKYIDNQVFQELYDTVMSSYQAKCSIEYSKDSLLKGWNIKLRKAGRTLCTIYPKQGYMTVLVVVGAKEKPRVEAWLSQASSALRMIYAQTKEGMHQRWLMIDLMQQDALYEDVLTLIDIRRGKRKDA